MSAHFIILYHEEKANFVLNGQLGHRLLGTKVTEEDQEIRMNSVYILHIVNTIVNIAQLYVA